MCAISQSAGSSTISTTPYDNIRQPLGETKIPTYAPLRFLKDHGVFAALVGMILVVLCAYWPTADALWGYWIFLGSQGVLICALSVYLLWRARSHIAHQQVRPELWLSFPLVLCSIMLLVFWKAGVQALELLLLPMLILLAIAAAFGRAILRVAAVPILLLYFAMPGWNFLSVPLQNLTLSVVRWVSPVIGLPATVSGSIVTFPNGTTFEVTLACSGIGFLVQALAIAVLLGELEQATLRRRFRLFAAAIVLALVANWVRALVILQIGYSTNMRSSLASTSHLELGYVLFVLALVMYVWIATRSAPPDRESTPTVNAIPATWRPQYITTLVALTIAPLLVAVSSYQSDQHKVELSLPEGRGGWRGPVTAKNPDWKPRFIGSHDERHGIYDDAGGHQVEVVGIGYDRQEQGRELVNEDNSIVGDSDQEAVTTELVASKGMRYVEATVVDRHGHRSIIWSFYDIGGRTFITPLMSQLWYGVHSLTGTPYSALIALRTTCADTCADARATLESFVSQMGGTLANVPAIAGKQEKSLSSQGNSTTSSVNKGSAS